jgi:hypothetical protein
MSPLALLPLVVSVVGALGARFVPRILAPRWATMLLAAVALASASSTAAALLLVVFAALAGAPVAHHWIEWCRELYDARAPLWTGAASTAVLLVAGVRLWRCRRRWHAAVAPWTDAAPLEVLDGPSTDAFAVPGRPGSVVIGEGLLSALEADERRVVLAHERAHLAHRHHWYLQVADAAAAAFPYLAPIADQVRYSTERWADEVAADEVGDRRLVARAILKAALAGVSDTPLPAVAAIGHVRARVHALVEDDAGHRAPWPMLSSALSAAVALAGSSVQLHHLAAFVAHTCSVHMG